MTRKHFEVIADYLKAAKPFDHDVDDNYNSYEFGRDVQWEYMTLGLADILEQQNPKFKRDRFLIACGLDTD